MASSIEMDFIKDDKYRFAYDLVSEVMDIRGARKYIHTGLPTPRNILFLEHHKDWIRQYLVNKRETETLDQMLRDNLRRYQTVDLNMYFDSYKGGYIRQFPKDVDEFHFIRTCAQIAYIGAYFSDENEIARNEAVEFIYQWVLSLPNGSFLSVDDQES